MQKMVSFKLGDSQDLPFEELVKELQPERDMSRNPLVQVSFSMQNVPKSDFEITGLDIKPIRTGSITSVFDMEVDIIELENHLEGSFLYNKVLFDSSTISRMIKNFITLLEKIVSNPDGQISEIGMLSEGESEEILLGWNDTDVEYSRDKCIHDIFDGCSSLLWDFLLNRMCILYRLDSYLKY